MESFQNLGRTRARDLPGLLRPRSLRPSPTRILQRFAATPSKMMVAACAAVVGAASLKVSPIIWIPFAGPRRRPRRVACHFAQLAAEAVKSLGRHPLGLETVGLG